jgi:hypothetical protein
MPPTTSNILTWYDASNTSSYTLSGSNVTQWNDLTGNGYHLTPHGTGPTVTTIRALPALNFDTKLGLSCGSVPLTKEITLFMVAKYGTIRDPYGNFMHHGNRDTDWSLEDAVDSVRFQSNNENNTCSISATSGANYIWIGRMVGNNRHFWMYTDTTTSSSYVTAPNVTITTGNKTIYVGKSDTGEGCNGSIGEILYYKAALLDSDIDANLLYLKSKWFKKSTTLSFAQTSFYTKYVLNSTLSIPSSLIRTDTTDTYTVTHTSNNNNVATVSTSSNTGTVTVKGIGKTTANSYIAATTNFLDLTVTLITIIVVGSGATFTRDTLTSIDLRSTNLSGTVFTECNLNFADLFGATVDAATNFSSSTLTGLKSGRIAGITTLLPSGFKMI